MRARGHVTPLGTLLFELLGGTLRDEQNWDPRLLNLLRDLPEDDLSQPRPIPDMGWALHNTGGRQDPGLDVANDRRWEPVSTTFELQFRNL